MSMWFTARLMATVQNRGDSVITIPTAIIFKPGYVLYIGSAPRVTIGHDPYIKDKCQIANTIRITFWKDACATALMNKESLNIMRTVAIYSPDPELDAQMISASAIARHACFADAKAVSQKFDLPEFVLRSGRDLDSYQLQESLYEDLLNVDAIFIRDICLLMFGGPLTSKPLYTWLNQRLLSPETDKPNLPVCIITGNEFAGSSFPKGDSMYLYDPPQGASDLEFQWLPGESMIDKNASHFVHAWASMNPNPDAPNRFLF